MKKIFIFWIYDLNVDIERVLFFIFYLYLNWVLKFVKKNMKDVFIMKCSKLKKYMLINVFFILLLIWFCRNFFYVIKIIVKIDGILVI